ncbi:jg14592 [Pararge aegeria aegeria]|uniref:Jg14592 protein n=1 Tax=Pararge aegeria aegeria TaxID=348720 RepID=A0A8S4QYN2_9NEOP|nr:jg14592 [Pararge aegeria aegeria]
MSQMPQQGFVPEKIQEFNRRASQDATDSMKRNSQESTPKKEPSLNQVDKPDDKAKLEDKQTNRAEANSRQNHENKNPFSPHFYRSTSRAQGHFEMGPRGLDYSPHRMGLEYSNRMREYGPQRSTSIHGHELTDGPVMMKPEYLGHRNHFGSQIVQGGNNHPDVVFRQDYYSQVGFSPPRASRFSSQEYLNAPAQYGRWPDYRAEYRQRRRSQQDLHSLGHSPESGMYSFIVLAAFVNSPTTE